MSRSTILQLALRKQVFVMFILASLFLVSLRWQVTEYNSINKISNHFSNNDLLTDGEKMDEEDFFSNWPTVTKTYPCKNAKLSDIPDQTLSVVLFLAADLDSIPIQTFLSVVQFTKESGLSINEVIVTYISSIDQSDREPILSELKRLSKYQAVPLKVTEGGEDTWKAKLAGVNRCSSSQVLVVDDTYAVRDGFLLPMLQTLQKKPKALVYPVVDALYSYYIYQTQNASAEPHVQIHTNKYSGIYKLDSNFDIQPKAVLRDDLDMNSTSPALTGEFVLGRTEHMKRLLMLIQTGSIAELSLLAWLCGDGIYLSKCSSVLKTNYDLYDPLPAISSATRENLKQIYSMDSSSNLSSHLESCQPVSWYFSSIQI